MEDEILRVPPGVHQDSMTQHNDLQRRKTRKKLGPVKKHKGSYGPVGIGNANVDGGILNEIGRRVLKGTK